MVSLHYLKYANNLSDEETVARWVKNFYWQYLSGRQYFEYRLPIDPSSMTRWRKRIGVEGAEALLLNFAKLMELFFSRANVPLICRNSISQTVTTVIEQKYLKQSHCQKVSVDTTFQMKDIRFPMDARRV